MVTEGEAFDIQNDFTGLKLSEGDHVELKKAAMEDGTVFDYNHAGTYKCVYLVTPASGEAYLVARNITVTPREAETDGSNGGQEQETGDDEPEADPVLPTISRKMPGNSGRAGRNGGARRRGSRRIFR